MRTALCLTLTLLFVGPRAFAQGENTPQSLLSNLLKNGASASTGSKTATRFKPSGTRLALDTVVKNVTQDAEQQKLLRDTFEKMMSGYEQGAKSAGMENDLSFAVAYSVLQYWEIWKGKAVSEAGSETLVQQIRGAIGTPEMAKMSDAEKQRYYEVTLYSVFIVQFTNQLAAQGNDASMKQNVHKAAESGLEKLLGASPTRITITDKGLVAAGGSTSTSSTASSGSTSTGSTGGLALASYAIPQGYTKKNYAGGAVTLKAIVNDDRGRRHDCEIRLLPVRSAPGGAAKAFQALWKENIAADLQASDVSIAFRRLLPCKASCHYMGGVYKLKKDPEKKMYIALYVLDLGDKVQPFVISVFPGLTQNESEYDALPSAVKTLSQAALPFMDSLKLASAPPAPTSLFSRPEILGAWGESSSSMVVGGYYTTSSGQYAGAMTSAYGIDIKLNPDSTYKYKFVYANRGARDIGQDENEGKYTVTNDVILCNPKTPRPHKNTYRISGSGLLQTDKGVTRVLVLRGPNSKGEFELPPIMPDGKNWQGPTSWLTESSGSKLP